MLAVLAIVIILALVCVYAIDKIKPGWLRIRAGNFSIGMGQGNDPPSGRPPRDERRELEAGRVEAPVLPSAIHWRQPGSSQGAVSTPRGDVRPQRSGSGVPSSGCPGVAP